MRDLSCSETRVYLELESAVGRLRSCRQVKRERLKALERENRELKRANEILHKASAFFAQAEFKHKAK